MRHHVARFLVALQVALSCGGLAAQDTTLPPSPAKPSAALAPTQAQNGSASRVVPPAANARHKPADDLSLMLLRRLVPAPGYLRSVVRMAPSADNRVLRVTIDSQDFYRSSEIQLDGAAAPMSHFFDWKQMPAGNYQITATLIGSEGTRAERQTSFRVVGPGLDR